MLLTMKCLAVALIIFVIVSCSKSGSNVNPAPDNNPIDTFSNNNSSNNHPPATFDLDPSEAPKFVNFNYIDIDSIEKVSMFRSGIGHDYSDDFESCRSMKHYFMPKAQDWSTVKVYSPVSGTVVRIIDEWAGSQLHIQSAQYPAFTFRIFHVKLDSSIKENTVLTAGQPIGTHISNETMSDIAVAVHTSLDGPNDNTNREKGLRLMSFFHVMSDSLFNTYGVQSRNDFIINADDRNANPLQCDGEAFGSGGTIENWMLLD